MVTARRPGDPRREPAPHPRARRHLADRRRLPAPTWSGRRARRVDVGGGARFSARLEPLADPRVAATSSPRSARSPARRSGSPRSASLPSAPKRCRSSGCGAPPSCSSAAPAHPLVQPVRSPARLAGDHPPSRGGRLVLLPALLHGPAARGRHAQARARGTSRIHARARHLPVVPLRGSPARRRRSAG